jgi:endonuclease/exonuclease/phosphatase family metal-dependent hydrolase
MTGSHPFPAKIVDLAPPVHSVRILSLNTHKGFTALNRRFILPELRDAVRTLSTDIVFLQEVIGAHKGHAARYQQWPETPQYEFLADTMWPQFSYGRNAVYPDGDHGNALLSKFPILHYENLDVSIGTIEQRGLLHSVLDVPGFNEVHAICTHLGLRESHRQQQLRLLCKLLDSIPQGVPVIVAGDFNDWRQRADQVLNDCGMTEVFASHYGKPARSFPARWPLLRLDRVYLRNATAHNPQVLHQKPWSHLSDHAPLSVEIHL